MARDPLGIYALEDFESVIVTCAVSVKEKSKSKLYGDTYFIEGDKGVFYFEEGFIYEMETRIAPLCLAKWED